MLLELFLVTVGMVAGAFAVLLVTGIVVVAAVAALCLAFGAVLHACYAIWDWLEERGWRRYL